MRWLYQFPLRLRSVFHRQQSENDLREEFQSHLQFQAEQFAAQGMNPEEAWLTALRSIGGVEQLKEECRDARNVGWFENFLRDLRFGARMLAGDRRQRGGVQLDRGRALSALSRRRERGPLDGPGRDRAREAGLRYDVLA